LIIVIKSAPSSNFRKYLFSMALIEALSIADYDAQRHILSIEIVRVFFLYSVIM